MTNYPTITMKRNSAGAVPSAGSLSEGELALETSVGVLYTKNHAGSVIELARYGNSIPPGTITMFGGTVAPAADVATTDYPDSSANAMLVLGYSPGNLLFTSRSYL